MKFQQQKKIRKKMSSQLSKINYFIFLLILIQLVHSSESSSSRILIIEDVDNGLIGKILKTLVQTTFKNVPHKEEHFAKRRIQLNRRYGYYIG